MLVPSYRPSTSLLSNVEKLEKETPMGYAADSSTLQFMLLGYDTTVYVIVPTLYVTSSVVVWAVSVIGTGVDKHADVSTTTSLAAMTAVKPPGTLTGTTDECPTPCPL